MPDNKVKILVTGATGYIGGAVLNRFLARPDAHSFDIRAVVRSPEKGEKLKNQFGITPIIGSHNDEPLMIKATREVDIVIAMADCDDMTAVKATLKGLRINFEETGKPPIFINTSGTGSLTDKSQGMYATETIYSDADPDQLETLAPTQPHRNVDLEIVGADKEGYIKSYIILPSMIYSIAKGPLFEAGISNPHSIQIPELIKASLQRKRAGMFGEGKNLWPNIDIHDLADLYSDLYDAIQHSPDKVGHGREGFYFGENGEHRMYDISLAVGQAMVKFGVAETATPTSFTKDEFDKYFKRSNNSENNSRCKAERSKSIGWCPKMSTKDLFESIETEVEAILKKM